MKRLLVLSVVTLALFSCSGNKKQAEASPATYELDQLLTVADQKVDATVTVVGYVTHTCKHSGKKCFIVGESQKVSLQVMAEGEIETFSAELVGSKLAITGTLKEERLSKEYIDEQEGMVKQLEKQEGMAEACAAELSNITEMRQWMKDQGKDYYVMYYMDGLKYNIVN
jgi:hypothetical protein